MGRSYKMSPPSKRHPHRKPEQKSQWRFRTGEVTIDKSSPRQKKRAWGLDFARVLNGTPDAERGPRRPDPHPSPRRHAGISMASQGQNRRFLTFNGIDSVNIAQKGVVFIKKPLLQQPQQQQEQQKRTGLVLIKPQ